MIPLRDNIPSSRTPYLNYAIIVLNSVAFFLELSLGPYLPAALQVLGFVPARLLLLTDAGDVTAAVTTMFTSMFLHAGWLHLIGNMWTIYIFGDNVEDTLGRGRYLLLYLVSGVAACLMQFVSSPHSQVAMVGASGAVAGVMGAYFFLFPWSKVLTLVPIFLFFTIIELPAYIFLGLWFLLQFFLGAVTMLGTGQVGGVAFWAHIGGFAAGVVMLHLLAPERVRNPFRHDYR